MEDKYRSNKMPSYNKLGGIITENNASLHRAKNVDLITLPIRIKGTNCGNCKWIKHDYCTNKKVDQKVNDRMCCILWTNHGEYREFEGRKKEFE